MKLSSHSVPHAAGIAKKIIAAAPGVILAYGVAYGIAPVSESVAQADTWEAPYVGSDPKVLYLPDAQAVYWRYGWKRQPGDRNGVVITGEMPDARYFSYNVYDDDTKSTLGSFTDFNVTPDGGGSNPFAGEPSDKRPSYTIYIAPEGTDVAGDNVLNFPDSVTNVSFLLRYYVPRGGIEGNVAMPEISHYDGESGKVAAAAPSAPVPALSKKEMKAYLMPVLKAHAAEIEADPAKVVAKLRAMDENSHLDVKGVVAKQVVSNAFSYFKPGQPVRSYRLSPEGTYPNDDNLYLVMPVVRSANDVLLVQYRYPAAPPADPGAYPSAPVRYFSLSQGDDATYNLATLVDTEMKAGADGKVHVVIADDNPANRDKASALGAQFMPWAVGEKMLLVYRHMLPRADFKYGIDKVAKIDHQKPADGQEGSAFIGDYSPVGVMVQEQVYRQLQALPAL